MDSLKLDLNIINPFIQGAIDTFKIQCSFDAKPQKPFIKGKGPLQPFDIAAEIDLNSPTFNGSVAICFPKNVFLKLMSNMLSEKYESITQELEDGVCELLNITFGQAKKTLKEKGFQIEKAIPKIRKESQTETPNCLILPFDSDLGGFHIEISWNS